MDESKAVIPGVRVVVTNVDTGTQRESFSNEVGYYTVPLLEPGNYRVFVQKEGFKGINRSGLTLEVNQTARIDFLLEVGAVSEAVDVVGAAPVVERETAALGAVISNQSLVNLPLNARNPYSLALLVPGVIPSTADTTRQTGFFMNAGSFQVNGGRGNTSEFLIDGVNNTSGFSDPYSVVPALPSVDAVQEFKVQTNSYAAEFGRSGGGVINVAIKTGGNALHGTAYEFLRNSKMDANDFFANRAGRKLATFQRNQFGFSLGGPILRDRAFYFVSYEGQRERTASTLTTTVPTIQQRRGDFRETSTRSGANCVPVRIFDATTTRRNPNGTGFIRDQFPDNVIPAARFDAVGARILTLYPEANTPGAACTGINNFASAKSQQLDTNQIDLRLDWNPTARNKFFTGLNVRSRDTIAPNHYGTLGNTGFSSDSNPSGGARIDYTRIQSPTFILNFKFGVNRVERNTPPQAPDLKISQFGFPDRLQAQMSQPITTPPFAVIGYGGIGQNCCAFIFLPATSYNWNGNASWVKGRHTAKYGVDYRIYQTFEYTGFSTSGQYQIGRDFTQGPDPNIARPDAGDGVASLLVGLGSGSVQVLPGIHTSNRYVGFYLQDDIKVTTKLTVNLGIRYDLENGRRERFNRLSWFDLDAASPLARTVAGFPQLRGGLRFLGIDADRQFDTDKNNFAPRIGIAYSWNPRTVIRTGYGIFYPPFVGMAAGAGAGFSGFQAFTPWVTSLDGLSPSNYLSNAYPNGLNQPTGSSLGLLTNVGSAFGETDREGAIIRNARSSYVQQWNFNLQRELPGGITAEAAYAGSKGTKLANGPRGIQLNQLTPDQLGLGTALQELVTNPFFGQVTATGPLSQPRVTRGQLLRPYPHFLGLLNFRPTSASSIYHAFTLRVQKQFSGGSSFMLAYTNSKLIGDSDQVVGFLGRAVGAQNAYDRRPERSLSAMDVSQRLVLSYVYQLPLGRGRRFGGDWPAWLSFAIGNWQVNGITVFSRGVPIAVSAPNTSQSFSDSLRPNVVGNPKLSGDRSTTDKLAQWFDPDAFRQPAPFTFGNGPRVLPNVRADGIRNFDFSLFKEFVFLESRRIQFRAEYFNSFNTPQFGYPGAAIGNATFGVVSAQGNVPRQVQLGLKVVF